MIQILDELPIELSGEATVSTDSWKELLQQDEDFGCTLTPRFVHPSVEAHFTILDKKFSALSNTRHLDKSHDGKIYVCASSLVWFSDKSKFGMRVDYPSIIIHAVVKEEDGQRSCVYAQLDASKVRLPNGEEVKDEAGNIEDEDKVEAEDADKNTVSSIFDAMSECSSLHPNEGMDESDPEWEELEDNEFKKGRFEDAEGQEVEHNSDN
jgi:hypothetical protein